MTTLESSAFLTNSLFLFLYNKTSPNLYLLVHWWTTWPLNYSLHFILQNATKCSYWLLWKLPQLTVYSLGFKSAGSLFLFIIRHAVVVCCHPKRLGTDFPRRQLALSAYCPFEDSAFTHTASFHNGCFEQFVDKERVRECHNEIIGLILLSLDKCRNPLYFQITGNERDWWGKSEKEKRAACVNCRV